MFWVTTILFAAFVLILTTCIIILFRQNQIQLAKAVMPNVVFYLILFICIFLFRLTVPYWTLLLTMAASFISGYWGQYLKVYYRSKVFDRYLHAFGAFSFALLFFYLMNGLFIIDGTPLFLAVFVFLLANTLGVVFELLEFSHDRKPSSAIKAQHGLKDTDMDLLFNLIGSAGAAVFVYFTAP